MLLALVTGADVQDRDGGVLLLCTLFRQFPFLHKLFADQAYARPIFHDGASEAMPSLAVDIVKRSKQAKGFVVEAKRWIVERTVVWLSRCRRLARDWEIRNHSAPAFLRLVSTRIMLRKLCNPARSSRTGSYIGARRTPTGVRNL